MLPSSAAADEAHTLSHAKSSAMASNTTNVINGTPQPGTLLPLNGAKFAVRSIPLGDIKVGETIKALSEVEVTNDLVTRPGGVNTYHDMAAELTLIIGDSATATTGIEVAEAQASTVTPQVHHWTFEASGSFAPTQNLSGRFLNLVMWAHSPEQLTDCWTFPRSSLPNPQQPRQCGMDVDFNRGHLSVLRSGVPSAAPADAVPFSVEQFSGQSVPETLPSDVPITYSGDPPQLIIAMARPVGTLQIGDILSAHSELQADARNLVRSDVNCNVGFQSRLYLSPSPTSLDGATALGPEGGNNFTGQGARAIPTLERGVVPSSATVKLTQAHTSPRWVVLRVWTIGNSACEAFGNGIRVQLEQARSFMHVTRYRPTSPAGLVVNTVNSGDSSEQASQLNVVTEAPVSVYSREVKNLAPGDLIEVLAEVEVGAGSHRSAVHSQLVLADSPAATTGTPLAVENHTEVNPYMGTLPIHDSTAWTVPAGVTGSKWVNLVVRAQALQTLGPPSPTIPISPDDGRLLVQHFRPLDVTPPETTIDSGPTGPTLDPTPQFTFSSSEPNSRFECRLDSTLPSAFAACTSPHTTQSLGDGPHTFEVRAIDRAENPDSGPASRAFTVDTVGPAAPAITDTDPNSPANDANPEVKGTSSADTVTVEVFTQSGCAGASTPGTKALFEGVGVGVSVGLNQTTQLSARAIDAAGNPSSCSSAFPYAHDNTPPAAPAITDTDPDSPSPNASPAVKGTASADTVTVELFTQAGCAGAATSGTRATFVGAGINVGVGQNQTTQLSARARDAAGNASSCSSAFAYTHDNIPPAAPAITDTDPNSPANDANPEVKGTSSADTVTVELFTQSGCAGAATSGTKAAFGGTGISVGVGQNQATQLSARARDAGGNASACSPALAYTHDNTPPAAPAITDTDPNSPANDANPEVKGTSSADTVTVEVFTQSGCAGASTPGTKALFEGVGVGVSVGLNQTTQLSARAIDAAGNPSSCSSAFPYAHDNTPPAAPAITDTDPDSPSPNASPAVKGTASADTVTVELFTQAGCAGAATSGTRATFVGAGINVGVGQNQTTQLSARARDAAGNASSCSSAFAYTHDNIPPAAPAITDTDPDSPAPNASPAVKGTSSADTTTIELFTQTGCAGAATSGTRAAFVGAGINAGVGQNQTTQLSARARDAAGNASSCSSAFAYTHDNTPPAAPAITDTDPDSPSPNASPAVKGTSSADTTTIELFTQTGCAGAATSGTRAAFVGTGINAGVGQNQTTQLSARARDAAGNASTCSPAFAYTHDNTPPAAPAITDTDPDSPSPNASPTVKGTSSADTVTVELFTQSGCAGTATSGTRAAFVGTGINAGVGQNQTTQLSARARDAAGNASACSPAFAYTHDNTPPAAPAITDSDPDSPANENAPELKGSAEAGSTVRLYRSASCGGAIEVQGGASAFASPGLSAASVPNDSQTQFSVTATDAAGNTSACSATFTYTEDSTPPAAPQITDSDPDSPGNDNAPVLKGSAEAGSTVRLYRSASCGGAIEVQGGASAFASPGLSAASVPNDSQTQFSVTATDAAGNTSACSAAFTYTEDSTPPAAPAITDTDPVSPADDTNPHVKGTVGGGEPVSVSIHLDATCSGEAAAIGSVDAFTSIGIAVVVPANQTTQLSGRATDQAGNDSACSNTLPYTSFTTPLPPAARQTAVAETLITGGPAARTKKRLATFTFAASTQGASFECSLDGAGFQPCASPARYTGLSRRPHRFRVRAVTPEGNPDPSPAEQSWTIKKKKKRKR